MKDNLLTLTTEERNPASMNLPKMSIEESTKMMNEQDEACVPAVRKVLPVVNEVIKECVRTIGDGGRVVFIGAAHSGYLGSLDAFEANATFGCTNEFVTIVAGNFTDIMKTDGSAEDHDENAGPDLESRNVTNKDFVIALSSSGRTPYAIGALKWCKEHGVEAVSGPEVITGSTRLKSGTCQKMILNMITTITMAQLGNVYENLMIKVPPVSDKMRKRLEYIMTEATHCTLERAHGLLVQTNYDVKIALLMELKNLDIENATKELEAVKGNINRIL